MIRHELTAIFLFFFLELKFQVSSVVMKVQNENNNDGLCFLNNNNNNNNKVLKNAFYNVWKSQCFLQ